ncbi:CDP-glycerol glycerophosphotransferase family protein [Vibrio sp. SCSIO 43133]|uniref:CDP-glycerol glycerophosphotransferase family protein n=1 Tax=Vibrio sp. SCSIO 43133 TaxID=2802577 RepID=UPI0020766181|nr:CDP-glycerol glycerophosphotransferase family protein [Vibrio sp. SCSIO 43133]USE00335.1 CDP-glycerol glycerophosphotransferase family protein [Vibrio sp. SCSIO 43133]
MQGRSNYNYLYPLIKFALAKILVPVIQVFSWFSSSKEVGQHKKIALLVNSRCSHSTTSFISLIPELESKGLILDYHLVNYSQLSARKKIENIYHFFCQYRKADFVFLDDTFLPVSFCIKGNWFSSASVIQLWHSCGLFKRTGLDICNSQFSRLISKSNYKNYDLVTVSAENCVQVISNFMGIACETVKALGLSRTDYYFDEYRKITAEVNFRSDYPDIDDKKIVVYAPTYRGQPFNVDPSPIPSVNRVFDKLGEGYLPFVVPHPHEAINNNSFPLKHTLSAILHLVDILVTDYSSLAMEYMIANPNGRLILFTPDVDRYTKEIGFYIELEEVTSNVVKDETHLLETIVMTSEGCDFNSYKNKYLNQCDGTSTKKILQYLDL